METEKHENTLNKPDKAQAQTAGGEVKHTRSDEENIADWLSGKMSTEEYTNTLLSPPKQEKLAEYLAKQREGLTGRPVPPEKDEEPAEETAPEE